MSIYTGLNNLEDYQIIVRYSNRETSLSKVLSILFYINTPINPRKLSTGGRLFVHLRWKNLSKELSRFFLSSCAFCFFRNFLTFAYKKALNCFSESMSQLRPELNDPNIFILLLIISLETSSTNRVVMYEEEL